MEPLLMLVAAAVALVVGATRGSILTTFVCLAEAGLLTGSNQLTHPGSYTAANDLVFFLAMVGAPALVGAVWRARGRQLRELERLTTERTAQHAVELRTACLEEQNRIASRVQHDIIQTMGGIVLRSAGAQRSGDVPGTETLSQIEQAARRALDDLRRHIGVLREPVAAERLRPDRPGRQPTTAPGLGVVDLLAGATAVPLAVESVAGGHSRGSPFADVLVVLLLAVPLAGRRRRPLSAAAAGFGIAAGMGLVGLTPLAATVSAIVVVLLLSYAVGAYAAGWRRRSLGLVVVWAGVLLVGWATPAAVRDPAGLPPTLAWTGLAVLGGTVAAGRAEPVAARARLLAELEEGREVELRLATAEQRHAIARDLHDSVAATMTVVCLHAAAARRNASGDPAVVQAALDTIEVAAREGLVELRTSLDLLEGARADGLHGTGEVVLDLERVVASARATGLDVHAELAGHDGLPPDVHRLAARVVRESLVNAVRHAPGAAVDVLLDVGPTAVRVQVVDTGAPAAASAGGCAGTGHGLRGLAERLGTRGGRLEAGPHGSGFRVVADIPVGARVPA